MPPFHDRLIEVTRCRAGGMRLAAVGSALRASTFGPHAIGTERSVTVSSGTSFMLVVDAFLQKRVRVQNPDKDEVPSSGPARPTPHPCRSQRCRPVVCADAFGRGRGRGAEAKPTVGDGDHDQDDAQF
jgi:hypothetical protein